MFDDEFNTAPTSPTWINTLWGETNGTSASNVGESGGVATLTATNNNGNYQGAEISSSQSFSFLYGYAEASIKMPAGDAQGLWPAFWMLPTPINGTYHDGDGEIDIMEVIDGQNVDNVHLHHSGYTTAGAALDTGVDLSAGYHTYAINWQPDSLTFYFDGQVAMTCTGSIVPDVAEYLIFDLWVGGSGSWPGAPDSSTVFPNTMDVDWVHVWQSSGSVNATGSAAQNAVSATVTDALATLNTTTDTSLVAQLPDATGADTSSSSTSSNGDDGLAAEVYKFVEFHHRHRHWKRESSELSTVPLTGLSSDPGMSGGLTA